MNINELEGLADLEEEGVALPMFGKDGEPILGKDGEQATVTVVGGDSKQVRAVQQQVTRRQLRASRTSITPEEIQQNRINEAAAAITGWTGFEDDDGPWPCNKENTRKLMSAPFLLRQVEEGVKAHSTFFVKSLPS